MATLTLLYPLAVTATAFPLLYMWMRWEKSDEGRSLMLSGFALALLVDVTIVAHWLRVGDGNAAKDVTDVVLLFLLAGSAYLDYVTIRALIRRKKDPQ